MSSDTIQVVSHNIVKFIFYKKMCVSTVVHIHNKDIIYVKIKRKPYLFTMDDVVIFLLLFPKFKNIAPIKPAIKGEY